MNAQRPFGAGKTLAIFISKRKLFWGTLLFGFIALFIFTGTMGFLLYLGVDERVEVQFGWSFTPFAVCALTLLIIGIKIFGVADKEPVDCFLSAVIVMVMAAMIAPSLCLVGLKVSTALLWPEIYPVGDDRLAYLYCYLYKPKLQFIYAVIILTFYGGVGIALELAVLAIRGTKRLLAFLWRKITGRKNENPTGSTCA